MSNENKIGVSGIGIPAEILFNPEIKNIEMNIFGFIRILSMSSKGCFASNEYLAQMLMCGPQTISNGISKLNKLKYINIKIKKTMNGAIRRIYINDKYMQIYRPLVESVHDFLEKLKESEDKPNQYALKNFLYSSIKKIIEDHKISYSLNIDKDINNDKDDDIFFNKLKNSNDFSDEKSKRDLNKQKILEANKPTKQRQRKSFKEKKKKSPRNRDIRLVEYVIRNIWNKVGTVTTHRIDPENKTYQKIELYLIELINGEFTQDKYFDETWLNRLPNELINDKKWTHDEIKQVISDCTKYSMPGYWPEKNKDSFKNLSNIIYNPRTGKSMFIQAAANPPKTLKESRNLNQNFSKDEEIEGMQQVFLEELNRKPDESFSMFNFEKCVRSIKKEFESANIHGDLPCSLNLPVHFIRLYGEFLSNKWPNVNPEMIGPKTLPFKEFKNWLINVHECSYEYK